MHSFPLKHANPQRIRLRAACTNQADRFTTCLACADTRLAFLPVFFLVFVAFFGFTRLISIISPSPIEGTARWWLYHELQKSARSGPSIAEAINIRFVDDRVQTIQEQRRKDLAIFVNCKHATAPVRICACQDIIAPVRSHDRARKPVTLSVISQFVFSECNDVIRENRFLPVSTFQNSSLVMKRASPAPRPDSKLVAGSDVVGGRRHSDQRSCRRRGLGDPGRRYAPGLGRLSPSGVRRRW